MNKNVVITATNSTYFQSLLTLISSIHEHSFKTVDEIIVFNLGLTETEILSLNEIKNIKVINFTADELNSHEHFMTPKWHVYKLTCLKNGTNFGENILWLDSGVCAIAPIDIIFNKIENEDIFFVSDTHLTVTYTHKNCQKIMNATENELQSNIISSGVFGFKSNGKYQNIVEEAYKFSLIPGCCDGDEENHRHDQSILSILKSRYNCPSNDIDIYGYWTDSNRNLQTAKSIGSVIFVHRRGHHDVKNIVYKNNNTKTDENLTYNQDKTLKGNLVVKLFDENLSGQFGLSKYINPESGWIQDINNENYDVAIYTDRMCYNSEVNPNKLNFAWLIEPPIINGENYRDIPLISNKFLKVFSHNQSLSNKIDNFNYLFHGGTWLRNEDIGLHDKNKNISFIYSDKQWNMGHKIRHNFAKLLNQNKINISFYGSGSDNPIEYKIDGLKNFRYSIVIENSVQDDYFTEKIIDCFLTGTIPIYWGTKNIGKYFDIEGIIFLDKVDEWGFDMESSLGLLSSLDESLYNSKLNHIVNNFNIAHKFIHPEKTINEFIINNFGK